MIKFLQASLHCICSNNQKYIKRKRQESYVEKEGFSEREYKYIYIYISRLTTWQAKLPLYNRRMTKKKKKIAFPKDEAKPRTLGFLST